MRCLFCFWFCVEGWGWCWEGDGVGGFWRLLVVVFVKMFILDLFLGGIFWLGFFLGFGFFFGVMLGFSLGFLLGFVYSMMGFSLGLFLVGYFIFI